MSVDGSKGKPHPAKYWRTRAEEFRTKADNFKDGPAKDALRKAAQQSDELARLADIDERHGAVQEYADDKRAVAAKLRRKMD